MPAEIVFENPVAEELDAAAITAAPSKPSKVPSAVFDIDSDDETSGGGGNAFASLRADTDVASKTEHVDEREIKRQAAIKYMSENRIISPDGTFRKRWDAMQIFLLAYVAVVVPYRIGFTHDTICNKEQGCSAWFAWDAIVDFYFIVDIVLSFRTGYYNRVGDLEYSPPKIIHNYLRSWFVIDTLGCLPVNYVVLLLDDEEAAADARFNKVLRLLKLARLLKLLRLMRLNRLVQRYEEEFYALASGFAMLKILVSVGIIGHWLACLWYYVGALEDPAAIKPDGTQIDGWVEQHFGGQASGTGYPPRYLMSIYWAFMTMTTVGYGDISAGTGYEKWVAVFGMLIGGFTFGLIVGSLGEMARKSNPGESYRSKRIGHISAYLAGRGVSADLMRRVRMYFSNHYQISSVFGITEVEDYYLRLPIGLRDELAMEVGYLGSTKGPSILHQVKAFHHIDDLSSIIICSKMKTMTYDKSELHHREHGEFHDTVERDYVFRKGERAFEMLVVIDGRLTLVEPPPGADLTRSYDGEETVVKFGHCIDEHAMLLPPETSVLRSCDAYAPVECSVAALSSEDLTALRLERIEIDQQVRPFCVRAQQASTSRQIGLVFERVDDDNNGTLDKEEFAEVLRLMGSSLTEGEAELQYAQILGEDAGGKVISREQFEAWWRSSEGQQDEDGGTISVLETLQIRMRDVDESSVEIEEKLKNIMKLLQVKLNK